MEAIGRMLALLGVVVVALGLVLMFFDKVPFLGKLPGDIVVKRENFRFYFPITSSIGMSVIVSVIMLVISYLRGK